MRPGRANRPHRGASPSTPPGTGVPGGIGGDKVPVDDRGPWTSTRSHRWVGSLRPGHPASTMDGIGTHPCCWGRWGPARAPDGWPVHPGRAPIDQMTLFRPQKVPKMAGELRPSEMRLSASLNHYLPHNSSETGFASISVCLDLRPLCETVEKSIPFLRQTI